MRRTGVQMISVNHNTTACRHARRGFSLVELIVVIGIIALLAALLMPAIGQSRASARRVDCAARLRNVTIAMLNVADSTGRFPACGNFTDKPPFETRQSWVIDVLPWLDQANVANSWNSEASPDHSSNTALAQIDFPVLDCPADISIKPSEGGVTYGNLSYVVNGGVGFTTYSSGIHDCPVDVLGNRLDLNGNGIACPSDKGDSEDKAVFFQLGLFFNETWKGGVSKRHHTMATVTDGLSSTIILSENVRTGYNPGSGQSSWTSGWASPSSFITSFYIGDPCLNGQCNSGKVDYQRANSGDAAINSGLRKPEGKSPVPNSFHQGGVNASFGDGRVQFLSQSINGVVYAALVSPQGAGLAGGLLDQRAGEN